MKKYIDVNQEFIIQRRGSGIVLARPDYNPSDGSLTVISMLELPFNVYFLNTESVIQNTNEQMVKSCGFLSTHDAIGRTVRDVAEKITAEYLIQNDKMVMNQNQSKISDDNYISLSGSNEINHAAISIKFPWYDNQNKVIGVFGCSILTGNKSNCSLPTALSLLMKSNLLLPDTFTVPGKLYQEYYLSKREIEVLRLLVRGGTAKGIARILGLSNRTVEHYIENIKAKCNTYSRSELIDKFIEDFS